MEEDFSNALSLQEEVAKDLGNCVFELTQGNRCPGRSRIWVTVNMNARQPITQRHPICACSFCLTGPTWKTCGGDRLAKCPRCCRCLDSSTQGSLAHGCFGRVSSRSSNRQVHCHWPPRPQNNCCETVPKPCIWNWTLSSTDQTRGCVPHLDKFQTHAAWWCRHLGPSLSRFLLVVQCFGTTVCVPRRRWTCDRRWLLRVGVCLHDDLIFVGLT